MAVLESYQDSIEDILPRLPVKSLVRFKCVSKSWRSLISSPLFIKTHLKRASDYPKLSAQRILFATSSRLRSLDPEKSISSSDRNANVVFDYRLIIDKGQARIVGSCNGLVCLALADKFISWRYQVQSLSLTNENDFILWNPSTRESKRLPNPCTPDVRYIHGFGCGFGYDSSSDDYKVVLIYSPRPAISAYTAKSMSMLMSLVKVSIFSLKENSWRIFGGEVDDFMVRVKRSTFLNGVLHWRFAHHILGFDLAKETFFKIQFPASCVPYFDKGLGVLNGCLCFLKAPDYDPEIWVMEEYGNPESWTKLLLRDFDCRDILRLCYYPNGLYTYYEHFPVSHALLCISKDDDGFVLIDDARELLRFDVGGKLLERFVICNDPSEEREAILYTESLVSPNNT